MVNPNIERSGKNTPIESLLERQIKLSTNRYVDEIVAYEREEDLQRICQYFEVNVRFLGSDYAKQSCEEDNLNITETGTPIEYIDSIDVHTSEIRERIKKA